MPFDIDPRLLVSLHKCKECGARMFEHDRAGHLARHGVVDMDVDEHFQKGKRDTPIRPFESFRPIKQPARSAKKRAKETADV